MRKITKIILHCSASSIMGQKIAMIRAWHIERGFKDVGYHYFIGFLGLLEEGRPLEEVGAHCYGENENSIGICLAGLLTSDFRPPQFDSLRLILKVLKKAFPDSTLHAHNEFVNKLCPVFDVAPWKEFWDKL